MRLLVLVALLALAAPAAADPIAQLGDQAPIAAHGGWIVWSAKRGAAFRLFAWHDGPTTQLDVRGRQRPFDVDVGTDARGRAVATFSRCRGFRTIPSYEIRRESASTAAYASSTWRPAASAVAAFRSHAGRRTRGRRCGAAGSRSRAGSPGSIATSTRCFSGTTASRPCATPRCRPVARSPRPRIAPAYGLRAR